ncbi:MAG: hypothetical protein GVY13_06285 [Alphaproteobacteria bacterium]|jgi:hypothetical protein|nr:hypothetical protein [Alphaproteobacteria bacterium]
MAERKSALKRAPERPELRRLLDRAKSIVLTEDQLQEQRASFVYGNAPYTSKITKESAIRAANRTRLSEDADQEK